ncbi:hypothetical protein [Pampinifervens florentissimum]|uniref:hypothetical protein n=1 Tax=Pampinifervens florentissimum TaxID=1632019 RepID=UPI0013B49DD2|nr:hypothetical protein [Hydrogenobacter sp. T-8]QID33302.1 hypothetical protein G3M65_05780 [Hydrogenobacter sp. T-8]
MRSWVYYIEISAYYQKGSRERASAVYVVALPEDKPLNPVDMECYASEYAPVRLAIEHGMAYAIGFDEEIKNPQDYDLMGYREDMELYVFKEGLSFKEGLERVYRLLYESIEKEDLVAIEPVVDVGSPPKELMFECLKRAIST